MLAEGRLNAQKKGLLKSTADPLTQIPKGDSLLVPNPPNKQLQSAKSASTLNLLDSRASSNLLNPTSEAEKVRASTFLRGESTRTLELLRRECESKELRVRELTHKCEGLVQKLKKYLSSE